MFYCSNYVAFATSPTLYLYFKSPGSYHQTTILGASRLRDEEPSVSRFSRLHTHHSLSILHCCSQFLCHPWSKQNSICTLQATTSSKHLQSSGSGLQSTLFSKS